MNHEFEEALEMIKNNEAMQENMTGIINVNILAHSPETCFRYSSSLEEQPIKITHSENKQERSHGLSTKSVTFMKNEMSFAFNKENFIPNRTHKSALTTAISEYFPTVSPKDVVATRAKANPATSMVTVAVFVTLSTRPTPFRMTVNVISNSTVEQLIEAVCNKINNEPEKIKLEELISSGYSITPRAFQLMLAEDDGKPESDTPALQRDAEISRFGCATFALCKDPDFTAYNNGGKVTLKVVLPSTEYQVLSIHPTLTLKQVMEKVCQRRMLDPTSHYFISSKEGGSEPFELDTLISELDATEIVMKCKAGRSRLNMKQAPQHIRKKSKAELIDSLPNLTGSTPQVVNSKVSQKLGLPQQFFFSPSTVAQTVLYAVVKINKYAKKQDRILGIDSERITNSMPPNSRNGKTHMPVRMITDVIKAFIVDRPSPFQNYRKPFCIEFKDGIREYESDKADEIVARVNFILSMYKKDPMF